MATTRRIIWQRGKIGLRKDEEHTVKGPLDSVMGYYLSGDLEHDKQEREEIDSSVAGAHRTELATNCAVEVVNNSRLDEHSKQSSISRLYELVDLIPISGLEKNSKEICSLVLDSGKLEAFILDVVEATVWGSKTKNRIEFAIKYPGSYIKDDGHLVRLKDILKIRMSLDDALKDPN